MNTWIVNHEAIWLFWLIGSELIVGLATLTILILEYFYDAKIEESKHKRRHSSNKVKVVIDKHGHGSVTEAPKGMAVSIESEGQ